MKHGKRKFDDRRFDSLRDIARGWDRWGKQNAARKAARSAKRIGR